MIILVSGQVNYSSFSIIHSLNLYPVPQSVTTSIFRFITLKMGDLSTEALVKAGVAFDFNGFIVKPYLGF
ncbi:MAG: hypothetical protein H7Y18_07455 [Clostridiaceae bacterium]|nr:hypothetical protein [Clostridiaceae bacterium]